MEMRNLGGLAVPVVGLGCNNFGARIDADQTRDVVNACIDAGVTFFDTADIYGSGLSEEYLGSALGARRTEVIVATKFGAEFTGDPSGSGASTRWIETAVEGSLRRLGTDYIDLYQLHVPDGDTPIEETLSALNRLIEAGKVRAVGCSNFSAEQIEESATVAADSGASGWVSVQNQFSLLHREPQAGVLATSQAHGMGFLPFFPLHAGLLTGKYGAGRSMPEGSRLSKFSGDRLQRFYNDDLIATVERLNQFCRERGRTLLELAFSWLLAHPPVASVIAGATSAEQVEANAGAVTWEFAEDDLTEVDAILAPQN